MKKKLLLKLFIFFNHSEIKIRMIMYFLVLFSTFIYSTSFGSRQSLRKDNILIDFKLNNRKRNPEILKPEFINISTLYFKGNATSYTLSSVPEAAFLKLMFYGIDRYFLPDTTSRTGENEYIKSLGEDKFKGGRTARWYYAWVIFKHYPLHKKLFGGGFDYLEMFGKEFGETEYDYPHNPFISAFLYSGIIGGLLYILFMIMVFYYYIKYWRYHIFFLICFLVVFFFSFVSADTHFSIPVFAFFSFVPFLTKYIVDKESLQNSGNNTNE